MADLTSGFLRFEVDGHVFAIPMAQLAGIQEIGEGGSLIGVPQRDTSNDNAREAQVAPIDLKELFFNAPSEAAEGFIVVVRSSHHMYVLQVDRVRAGTEMPADEREALPPILRTPETPFSGMFSDADGWGLIVDTDRLAGLVRERYGGRAVEHLYDID